LRELAEASKEKWDLRNAQTNRDDKSLRFAACCRRRRPVDAEMLESGDAQLSFEKHSLDHRGQHIRR